MVSIIEAIERGKRTISVPCRRIMTAGILACIVLSFFVLSWWNLILIALGFFFSYLFEAFTINNWRIWSYQNVGDIYQFQRSAELSGLVMRQSKDRIGGFISKERRAILEELLLKFYQDPSFQDDTSIPDTTSIYLKFIYRKSYAPALVLSELGVRISGENLIEWKDIKNDRIDRESYSRQSGSTGGATSGGYTDFFRFDYPEGTYECPITKIDYPIWKLDLLMYIYNGRYIQKNSA